MTNWKVGDSDRRGIISAYDDGPMTLQPGEYALVIDNNAADMSQAVKATVGSWIDDGIRVFQTSDTFIGNRLVDNGDGVVDGVDTGTFDMGIDEVVISDATGLVVDKVSFDTTMCGIGKEQDISLEREDPLASGDCSNLFPGEPSTPGRVNLVWTGTPITDGCICIFPNPPPPRKKIIITEIMFNPLGGSPQDTPEEYPGEWVEILNNECSPVDLTGWRLGDGSLADGLTPVPEGASMELLSGERAVFIPFNSAPPSPIPAGTRIFKVGNSDRIGSGLNNDNDVIYIYDDAGSIVDEIRYDCRANLLKNCGADITQGKSIERTDAFDAESFVNVPDPVPEGQKSATPGEAIPGFQNAAACGPT